MFEPNLNSITFKSKTKITFPTSRPSPTFVPTSSQILIILRIQLVLKICESYDPFDSHSCNADFA